MNNCLLDIKPPFWGIKLVQPEISEVTEFLNKKTLFRARWKIKNLPGSTAAPRKILADLMSTVESEKLIQLETAYGYFKCHRDTDTLVINNEKENMPPYKLTFPRQTQKPSLCIADYFRNSPCFSDVISVYAVTAGVKISEHLHQLYSDHRYSRYFLLSALAGELAEAGAKYLNYKIEQELKINFSRRYSLGYPCCPDLKCQQILLDIVQADKISLGLTDRFQLNPEYSTNGFIVFNPHAVYFKI
ncbi:MAG: vitamin B12 dependent-methionine synthase activation domain-containing protein [bacterium]